MSQPTSLPPLASIDEVDDDDDYLQQQSRASSPDGSNGYINSTQTGKVILTNHSPLLAVKKAAHHPNKSATDHQCCLSSLTMSSLVTTTTEEELGDTGFFSSSMSCSSKRSSVVDIDCASLRGAVISLLHNPTVHTKHYSNELDKDDGEDDDEEDDQHLLDELDPNSPLPSLVTNTTTTQPEGEDLPNLAKSLEDLVNCFDETVKSCLKNLEENVAEIAPVQVRSPEEVIKDRP